jgi:hypothetical protein
MAWADVPAKLALWSGKEYYMTDGIARLIADYDGHFSDPSSVPVEKRAEFEERLDYYLGATDNLAASVAWTPEMLRRV